MRKAYIIAAHKYPNLLFRLIERLDDHKSSFYIHIDLSVDIKQFDCLEKFGDKIKFVKRANSSWATLGQVHSSLNAMKEIVAASKSVDIVHFLSGQDYPIKKNAEIDAFFLSSDKSIFLEYSSMPNFEKWENGGMWRVNKYFLGLGLHQRLLSKATNILSTCIPQIQRTIPYNLKPYTGSCWFSMSLDAVKYILKYLDSHPDYERFHQYTFGSDELFYLMILLNSNNPKIVDSIENDNLRLIKWKHISSPSPETLTIENFDEISTSKSLFARKFDPKVDEIILDKIDAELLGRQ